MKSKISPKISPKISLFELFFLLIIFFFFILAFYVVSQIFSKAKERAFILQIWQFNQAIEAFTVKYRGLPGDIKKTQEYELSSENSDGNGDNLITDSNGKIEFADGEIINFWQHLQNSELLNPKIYIKNISKKHFPQTKNPAKYVDLPIDYFPVSKIGDNARILVFAKDGKNYFQLGINKILEKKIFTKAAISPEEALAIDKKIDDGDAARGFLIAVGGERLNLPANQECAVKNSYKINNSVPACQLRIEILE